MTGIWHGAAWNFILWGIWHGTFILLERYIKKSGNKIFNKNISIINRIYTITVVSIGWVLFRAGSIGEAIGYLKTMLGIGLGATPGVSVWYYLNKWNVTILLVAILCATTVPGNVILKIKLKWNEKVYFLVRKVALLAMFLFSLIRVVSGTYSPFIYFQF